MTETIPQDWKIIQRDSIEMLEREFSFPNFSDAMIFATKVGEIADAADHHPEITITWGRVSVIWWSHDSKGVTERDRKLARLTDRLMI